MQGRLIIRADGGEKLGFGHWSRCLFLASCYRSVKSGADILLFTKNPKAFSQAYPDAGIKVEEVLAEEEFLKLLRRGDIVLLGGYDFSADYFAMINQRRALLIYVDDLLKSGLQADIIINHSLGITPGDYVSTALYTSFYLGSSYSMVPAQFRMRGPVSVENKRLNSLLFCMGGADPANATARLLEQYHLQLEHFEKVYVVLGQQYLYEEKIRKKWGETSSFQILKGISKEKVCQLMQECESAILPASTMAVEYAHTGGILGVVKTAANQEKLFQGLLKEGVAVELQAMFEVRDKEDLYAQLVHRQSQIFDGLSQERFKKLFSEISLQQRVRLREAKVEDASLTYQWASDQKVRAFSFSREEISWEEHQQWFNRKLQGENCVYFIAELDKSAVGSIRFDMKNGEALISYLVDSSWHGKGLGRIILAEGIKYLQNTHHSFDKLVGFVMQENKASVRVFERMGFDQEVEEGTIRYFKKNLHE